MKIFAILVVAILLATPIVASADQTGSSWWHGHSYTDNDSYVDRYSENRTRMIFGGKLDVIVYRDNILGLPYTLGTQAVYDHSNKGWGFYGKGTLDISEPVGNGVDSVLRFIGIGR